MDENFSAGRSLQEIDTAHQGGFSCPGIPDDTEDVAFLDVDTHISYGVYAFAFLPRRKGFHNIL